MNKALHGVRPWEKIKQRAISHFESDAEQSQVPLESVPAAGNIEDVLERPVDGHVANGRIEAGAGRIDQ